MDLNRYVNDIKNNGAGTSASHKLDFPDISTLSPTQLQAFKGFQNFCKNTNEHNYYVLKGYAGTGKSYLVDKLVQLIRHQEPYATITVCAPTNDAVDNVRASSSYVHDSQVKFKTIHSLLGISAVEKEDQIVFEQVRDSDYTLNDYVIIDETSMIGKIMFSKYIDKFINRAVKTLFIGDPAQLNPIGEGASVTFTVDTPFIFELTDPQRQNEGDTVLEFATNIRNGGDYSYQHKYANRFTPDYSKGMAMFHNHYPKHTEAFEKMLLDFMCKPEASQNANYVRLLAFHRKEVTRWNKAIRRVKYDNTKPDLLYPDENIIITKPVFNNQGTLTIPANSRGRVLEIQDATTNIMGRDLEYLDCKVELKRNGIIYDVNIIKPNSQIKFDTVLEFLADRARGMTNNSNDRRKAWQDFREVKKVFAPFKYTYANTIHTSQGSSIENVFVLMSDIYACRDVDTQRRLTYVGVTRTAKRLLLMY